MTSSKLARLLIPLLAATTVLAGCAKERSDDGSSSAVGDCSAAASKSDLAAVGVDASKDKPTITPCTPFSVKATSTRVLKEGDGATVESGDRLVVEYVGVNATDGKEFDTSFGKKPVSLVMSQSQVPQGVLKALTGAKVGSTLLAAIPPAEGYGSQGVAAAGIGPTDTLIFYFQVKSASKVLKRATGEAVPPKAGLPTVKLSPVGAPSITIPKSSPPASLVVQPLIKGGGAVVKSGQTITVHYTGVIWSTGKTFDSSWGKDPVQFEIGTGKVIKGWDTGLVGQTIGSQVLLSIPPNDGYGAAGQPQAGIKGTDTLVFVVDILDAA
ncbi:MAG: FKBP-type peptidyl-prolyl cis-trans isomerase [Kineosporiaceae bacterium]